MLNIVKTSCLSIISPIMVKNMTTRTQNIGSDFILLAPSWLAVYIRSFKVSGFAEYSFFLFTCFIFSSTVGKRALYSLVPTSQSSKALVIENGINELVLDVPVFFSSFQTEYPNTLQGLTFFRNQEAHLSIRKRGSIWAHFL